MSKKNRNRDKFENIFRTKLNPDAMSPEAWNTPPDAVFEAAVEQIDTEKTDRRLIFIPFLVLALTAFVVLWFLNDSSKESQIDHVNTASKQQLEIDINSEENKDNTSISPALLSKTNTNEAIHRKDSDKNNAKRSDNLTLRIAGQQTDTEEAQTISNQGERSKSLNSRYETKRDYDKYGANKNENQNALSVTAPSISSTISGINSSNKVQLSNFVENEKKQNNNLLQQGQSPRFMIIEKLGFGPFDLLEKPKQQLLLRPVGTSNQSQYRENTHWEIQFNGGAEFQRCLSSNLYTEKGILKNYDSWSRGYYSQLLMSRLWNDKWGAELGLGYSMLQNNSQYHSSIATDEMQIIVDNIGHTHVAMTPQIESTVSDADMFIEYIMQYANTNNPGPADFKANINQSFQTAQASVGAFRSFKISSPFELRLHAGLNYRRIISGEEDMSIYVSHDKDLMIDNRKMNHSITPMLNRNLLEWYGGLSFYYSLSEKWKLQLSIQKNSGINKLNKNKAEVRMQTLQIGLGVAKRM